MKHVYAVAVGVLMLMLTFTSAVSPAEEPSETSEDRQASANKLRPDLGMARLGNFKVAYENGKRVLRFDSIVVNTGKGKFEVLGSRPGYDTSTMTVRQRMFNTAGRRWTVPTDAVMYFGGDGHNHWHVRDLETFELRRSNGTGPVRAGAKHGFCFYDNYRFGSSYSPYYTHCGDRDDLSVAMGLSKGWGDIYNYSLPDQYIDITGLADGRYRMTAEADEENWFRESNNTNNVTWVDLQLSGGSVRVVKHGPAARPI